VGIGDLLGKMGVVAGDAVYTSTAVVHALGAGTEVFEEQTANDNTFRLHDWPRETDLPSRELKVEQALGAAALSFTPRWSRAVERGASTLGCLISQFNLQALARERHALQTLGHDGAALIFVQGEGEALQTARGGYAMPAGRITALPASLLGGATVEWNGDESLLLVLVR
jgi:mannose-6-phosphate isomerase class I